MSEASDELIQLSILDGHLAIVTINRPDARNAVSARLAEALEATVARVEADPAIKVAIITGAGENAFCAGADLKEVAAGGLINTFTQNGGFAGFVNALRKKVWIAAVDGPALAGGFEIVLACDLVVASEKARFGLPEVKRGLIASAGGLYRLPRALPKAVSLELILTGDTLDSRRAFALGLVNRLVPSGQAVAEAVKLAQSICNNAPLALMESLAIVRAAAGFDDVDLRAAGEGAQDRLARTADYKEGSLAFIEKRTPLWKGE